MKKIILAVIILNATSLYASAKGMYKEIRLLYEDKKYDVALKKQEEFLEKYPNSKYTNEILKTMGQTNFLLGNYDESTKYFGKLLEDKDLPEEEREDYIIYLVRNELARDNINNIDKYEGMLQSKEGKTLFNYYLGVYYYEKNEVNKAKDYFYKTTSSKKESLFYLSSIFYNEKNYKKAYEYGERYLKEDSKAKSNETLNTIMGESAFEEGNVAAEKYFKRLLKSESQEYRDKGNLGLTKIAIRDGENYQETLIKIMSVDSKDKAYTYGGDYFLERKNYLEALSYYRRIKVLDAHSRLNYGYALLKSGDDSSALNILEGIERDEVEYPRASLYKGEIYYVKGQYNQVVNALLNINDNNYSKESAIKRSELIADSYLKLGKHKEAIDYLKTQKRDLNNLSKLIQATSYLKDTTALKGYFEEYKNKYKNDSTYKKINYLTTGSALSKNKEYEEAKNILTSYLKEHQGDKEVNDALISVLVASKDYQSLEGLLNGLEDTPSNEYWYGIALEGMGRLPGARVKYNSVWKRLSQSKDEELKEKTLYALIRVNNNLNKDEEALRNIRLYYAGKYSSYLPEVTDREAIIAYKNKDYQKSLNLYERLAKIPGQEDYSLYQQGLIYSLLGENEKASGIFTSLSSRGGKYQNLAKLGLIDLALNEGQNKEALKEINLALADKTIDKKRRTELERLKGEVLLSSGNSQEVVTHYKKLYAESQSQGDLEVLVKASYEAGQYNEAKKLSDNLEDKLLKSYWKGTVAKKEKDWSTYEKEYTALMKEERYKSALSKDLASYYSQKDDKASKEKALQLYSQIEEGLGKNEQNEVFYKKGQINYELGNQEKAIVNYNKVAKDSVYREDSLIQKGLLYEKQNNLAKANISYEQLLKEFPGGEKEGLVIQKLIVNNLSQNESEKAKKYYNLLKTKYPEKANDYKDLF